MDVHRPIKGLVNTTILYVTCGHITIKMEVYWVATKTECLTGKRHFSVGDFCLSFMSVLNRCVYQDHSTKLAAADLISKSPLETCLCCKLTCNENK